MRNNLFFFFSSRRRHTRSLRDWSSDVCSSDLEHAARIGGRPATHAAGEADQRGHAGIGLDDADDLPEARLHGLERRPLVGLDAALEPADVLLREESLR